MFSDSDKGMLELFLSMKQRMALEGSQNKEKLWAPVFGIYQLNLRSSKGQKNELSVHVNSLVFGRYQANWKHSI